MTKNRDFIRMEADGVFPNMLYKKKKKQQYKIK